MHSKTGVGLLAVLLFATVGLRAQTETWEQLRGPWTGAAQGLAVDGTDGAVYLGTWDGVLRSTNEGRNWEFLMIGLVGVHAVCVDAHGRVFAGSINGLFSWDRKSKEWRQHEESTPYVIWSLHCARQSGALFAGGNEGLLLHSHDGGETWTVGSVDDSVHSRLLCFESDAAGDVYVGTVEEGLWKSTDAGLSWQRSGDGTLPEEICSIAIDEPRQLLYAAGPGRVFVSTDGGAAWTETQPPVAGDAPPLQLAVGADGLLLAGASDGVHASGDGGHSWSRSPMHAADSSVRTLTYSPVTAQYLAVTLSGLYRLRAGETAWQHIGAPVDRVMCLRMTAQGTMLAGMSGALAISRDGGDSWTFRGPRGAWSIDVDEEHGLFYAGTRWSLFRSTDDGEHWEATTLGESNVNCVKVLPGGTVLAGTSGGVYVSTDQGVTWEGRVNGLTERSVYWLEYDRGTGSVYAGTTSGGMFRSDDLGMSWTALDFGLRSPSIAVAVNGWVYAGASSEGVHVSTDRGGTWTCISNDMIDDAPINWLMVNTAGALYVACPTHGVLKTTDEGVSWHCLDDGLLDRLLLCMELDRWGYLYAGTAYGGVFRTSLPTVRTSDPGPASTTVLGQNYPNPFSRSTDIPVVRGTASSPATLYVFDLLGRQVLDLTPVLSSNAGVVVTKAMLPAAGVYYYQLRSGGKTQTRMMLLLE